MRGISASGVLLIALVGVVGYAWSVATTPRSPLGGSALGRGTSPPAELLKDTQPVRPLPLNHAGALETSPRLGRELEGLRHERDPDLLVQRLLEVWRSAADGAVSDELLAELSTYTFDADPEIARTAALAIEDLEQLAARRAEEDAVAQWIQPPGPGMDRTDASEDSPALYEDRWLRESTDLEQRLAAVVSADPGEQLAAIQELWRYAADISEPGLLDWALDEIQALASPANTPEVAERLAAAARDLRQLADRRAVQTEEEQAAAVVDSDPDAWAGEAQAPDPSELRAAARNAEAAGALLGEYDKERDPSRRLNLAAALSGFEPGTAVQLSMQGLQDPDVVIRQSFVHLLWRQAADGHGSLSDVLSALEQALLDPDPQVRETTLAALEDLETLERHSDSQGIGKETNER
ncbi:exported hypothetical protein [Thiocapsa sp. KS1]|nr:exported hypothetical protein [Thiocapsa sp. KS1]